MIRDTKSRISLPAGSDRHDLFKAMVTYDRAGWNLSATYQYYSGSPTTDRHFIQSTGMLGNTFFVPVWEDLNSQRLPAYARLDVFVSKTFHLESWAVVPYVDIVNVLNSQNISHYDYGLDESRPPAYAHRTPAYNSLPFFPMIGVQVNKEW